MGITRSGENHHNWKNEVSYSGIHKWVQWHLGNSTECENCKKTDLNPAQIHWANISHQYKRDLTDWVRLCVSCHSKLDKTWRKRKRTARGTFI